MTGTPSKLQLEAALREMGRHRVRRVVKLCRSKGGPITADLALAIVNRESGDRNIAGDGGHGRGLYQFDDRYQAAWLGSVRGALSGAWNAVARSALTAGYVPLLIPATRRMRKILTENFNYARSHGIQDERVALRIAVAGWNAGLGGAMAGYEETSNADSHTTGGDYSKDVFRRRTVIREILADPYWRLPPAVDKHGR